MSDLLGRAVIDEVRPGERVLDMGTGSGVNAILAARAGGEVVGVDLNPAAVDAARANAERNGVAAVFAVSDMFSAVEGDFDLAVIDPPFRWFAPRDMAEATIADEGYAGSSGSSPGSANGCGPAAGCCCSSAPQVIRTTCWVSPPAPV
jgi:release factor glutamine methyltransferase